MYAPHAMFHIINQILDAAWSMHFAKVYDTGSYNVCITAYSSSPRDQLLTPVYLLGLYILV